jgi:alanyl-tRNA synthetase
VRPAATTLWPLYAHLQKSPYLTTTDLTPPLQYRKVAPNHTMTHVLNYALRKILGGEVDQKGSLVSDEKFRFDFSWGRAVNSDELSSVEAIVNEAVKAELTVHTEVVALKDALAVQGLRAVFGETYPDPVRVVSVGPKVSITSALSGTIESHGENFQCVTVINESVRACLT